MAAMVARGSSPLALSSLMPEKGIRNKRKFRADPPTSDPSSMSHSLEIDLPKYEFFPTDGPLENPNPKHHSCRACRNHVCGPREEVGSDVFQEADWSDLTESQLEETVLSNLDTIFKAAIKTIVSHGYTKEVATNAVLRSGVFYGGKDMVTTIVEHALTILRSGEDFGYSSLVENCDEELKKLERSWLGEMVGVLLEMRPLFSVGSAMWQLLISDMNVTQACAMECNALSSTDPKSEQESSSSIPSRTMPEAKSSGHSRPSPALQSPKNTSQMEMPTVLGLPNLPYGRFSASSNAADSSSSVDSVKEKSSERVVDFFSSVSLSSHQEMKSLGSKRGHMSSSKRELNFRQKTAHSDKSYRAKAANRGGKHGLSALLSDKNSKSVLESNVMKNTMMMKLNRLQVDPTLNLSFGDPAKLPTANTKLSLSLPVPSAGTNSGCRENLCGKWMPYDKKDEMLLRLVPRVHELRAQLQEWTDWGQQKVMQAARRLGKDKPELQTLRQEKEDVARLEKEKQALEESTRKKLAEMEIALSRASSQVEAANAAARSLQVENSELRKEMEATKRRAAESAASCQEVSSRETKTRKQFQSWEKQKALFHEELASEKRRLSQLQLQLEQAKEHRDQLEARWKQEEKAKDEALMQASTERKEQEKSEISGRAKENEMRLKAETDTQRYKEDVKELEQQISQLRNDSSKIAAPKWGTDGTYASRLSDGWKDTEGRVVPKFFDVQEQEEVERERECVMCWEEEKSVMFLPCAHQVVCQKCNERHEKQGMMACPSCRTHIRRRIRVRSAES